MRKPRERRGIGRRVLCVYTFCRVEEGTVGVSSLSGISKRAPSRRGLLYGYARTCTYEVPALTGTSSASGHAPDWPLKLLRNNVIFRHALKINPDKSKTQLNLFKKPSKLIPDDFHLILDNCTIKLQKSVKLLGVTLDQHLTFGPHIDNVANKCQGLLVILASLQYLPKELLKLIYSAIIRSHGVLFVDLLFSIQNTSSSQPVISATIATMSSKWTGVADCSVIFKRSSITYQDIELYSARCSAKMSSSNCMQKENNNNNTTALLAGRLWVWRGRAQSSLVELMTCHTWDHVIP